MKGGAGNRHPGNLYRPQMGGGCDDTGPPHLRDDILDYGHCLAWGEFPGDCPARRAGFLAQFPLQVEGINLYHYSVDLVGERFTLFRHFPIVVAYRIDAAASFYQRIDRESPLFQGGEEFALGLKCIAVNLSWRITEDGERTPGGDAWIELADGTCRGVARVGEGGLSFFFPFGVKPLKGT